MVPVQLYVNKFCRCVDFKNYLFHCSLVSRHRLSSHTLLFTAWSKRHGVSLYVFFDFENKAFLHINYPIMEDQLPDQEIIILENPYRPMLVLMMNFPNQFCS